MDKTLTLTSPVFADHGDIPRKYTCQGEDINPPLHIAHIPPRTVSFVLFMDDPDAPRGTWDHWVVWNIPVVQEIPENSVPAGAVVGQNSWPKNSYGGPCPPSGKHRYFFKLYALDTMLNLSEASTKKDVEQAMRSHIVAETQLVGLYQKA